MKRKKITFVCTGNTCRSPMAEIILRQKIKERKIKWWDVASRGIRAEVGGGISANSATVLKEIGLSSSNFKPKQLNQKIIETSEVVITMTTAQKQLLEGCGTVYSVKEICGYDVPDPYGADINTYRATRNAISAACDIIIEKIILK